MSRIHLCPQDDNPLAIQNIFDEIIEKVGVVPPAYRAFARHAHVLQANWNKTKNVMGKGNLSLQLKESIATRVSSENGCQFCLAIHQKNLEKMGVASQEIKHITLGENNENKLQKVLDFVSMATKNPHNISESDFAELKNLGYTEEDIVEMLTVMEMYTGYNKIIVALGLELDD